MEQADLKGKTAIVTGSATGFAAAAMEAWGRHGKNARMPKFASHGDLDALCGEEFAEIYAVNVIGGYQTVRAPASKRMARQYCKDVRSFTGGLRLMAGSRSGAQTSFVRARRA